MKINNWDVLRSFLVIIVLAFFVYLIPNDIVELSWFETKVQLFLTIVIGIFAFVEAFSTYYQMKNEKVRNQLEDIKNEMERVYAPLYSIFYYHEDAVNMQNYPDKHKGVDVWVASQNIQKSDKQRMDEIFFNNAHIITDRIYDYWQEHIRFMETSGAPSIEADFIQMITDEYNNKLNQYRKLLE